MGIFNDMSLNQLKMSITLCCALNIKHRKKYHSEYQMLVISKGDRLIKC